MEYKEIYLYENLVEDKAGIYGTPIVMKTIKDKPEKNEIFEAEGCNIYLYVVNVQKAEGTYSEPVYKVTSIIVTDNPMNIFLPEQFTKVGQRFKIKHF